MKWKNVYFKLLSTFQKSIGHCYNINNTKLKYLLAHFFSSEYMDSFFIGVNGERCFLLHFLHFQNSTAFFTG